MFWKEHRRGQPPCRIAPPKACRAALISESSEAQRSCFKQLQLSCHQADVTSGLCDVCPYNTLVVEKCNSSSCRFCGRLHMCETATFESDRSHPLQSPRVLISAFRKSPWTQKTRWGQYEKNKQESRAIFIEMSCSGIACWICNPYLCGLSYMSSLSASCYMLKLLKPLQNRTKFQSCFSKSQLQKWMAKEPEQQCDTYFLTHKIVSCP